MKFQFAHLPANIKQYLVITANYWSFTLTDGALRMLVLLHFHSLGFTPINIAMLFLFYEFFGVVTNLVGGWLGARIGLNRTMNFGLGLQIIALSMLLLQSANLSVLWVMCAQAFSGIAKDLNKMSAKSAIKLLIPASDKQQNQLYHWVSILTGSKNALKGVGFFLGAALLEWIGFTYTLAFMLIGLILVWFMSLILLRDNLGKVKNKPKFSDIFSKSYKVNILSAARLFLFAARDVWFVVALPVFLSSHLGWNFWQVGTFMACWVIGYGLVQSLTPKLTALKSHAIPDGKTAVFWALMLTLIPSSIAVGFYFNWYITQVLIIGLCVFGAVFAINSSLHSYLIVSYAKHDGVSLDVGFYYMANAAGRLLGTLLSGAIYQLWGLSVCLWFSAAMLAITALISIKLPREIT